MPPAIVEVLISNLEAARGKEVQKVQGKLSRKV